MLCVMLKEINGLSFWIRLFFLCQIANIALFEKAEAVEQRGVSDAHGGGGGGGGG
jgi:hypothetical protein